MDEWYETYVAPRKEFKLLLEDEEEEEREKEAAEGETAGLGDGGEEGTRSSTPASGTRNTADAPFPREDCMSILKASSVILENCNNRGSYGSVEVSKETRVLEFGAGDRSGADISRT